METIWESLETLPFGLKLAFLLFAGLLIMVLMR